MQKNRLRKKPVKFYILVLHIFLFVVEKMCVILFYETRTISNMAAEEYT